MSKAVIPADVYEYVVPDFFKKVAAEELRESESTINQSLTSLREWAEQNPRIAKIRLDSKFLLQFLRAKKYSIPMVQEAIERYLLLRDFQDGLIFRKLDYLDPVMSELCDLGFGFPLPKRDELGRRLVVIRPGVFDPHKHANYQMLRFGGIGFQTVLESEETQISGVVAIVDASGIGLAHMTLFTPKEVVRILRNSEKTLPIRIKSVNIININSSVKFAFEFGLSIVSEKMKNRVHLYTSAADLKINKSLLPKEYGGEIPINEMIELWKKELEQSRSLIFENDKMAVNLDMYSKQARDGAVSALKKPIGCSTEEDTSIYGIQGSFRKLEVD